jgi:hypothetical protein
MTYTHNFSDIIDIQDKKGCVFPCTKSSFYIEMNK